MSTPEAQQLADLQWSSVRRYRSQLPHVTAPKLKAALQAHVDRADARAQAEIDRRRSSWLQPS